MAHAIVRSSLVVSVMLAIFWSSRATTAYSVEREASVKLLPYDLLEASATHLEPEPTEPSRPISSPQQVIENQVVRIAEFIHSALEEARRNLRQNNNGKRDLGTDNYLPFLFPLMACFVKLANSGMLPESVVKGLLPSTGDTDIDVLRKNKHLLSSMTQEHQLDALSKTLGAGSAGGLPKELTGGPASIPIAAAPSVGVPGIPGGTATGFAAGAATGLAMAKVGETARDAAPALGAFPIAGGLVDGAPKTATGLVSPLCDLAAAYRSGYDAGSIMGRLLNAHKL